MTLCIRHYFALKMFQKYVACIFSNVAVNFQFILTYSTLKNLVILKRTVTTHFVPTIHFVIIIIIIIIRSSADLMH